MSQSRWGIRCSRSAPRCATALGSEHRILKAPALEHFRKLHRSEHLVIFRCVATACTGLVREDLRSPHLSFSDRGRPSVKHHSWSLPPLSFGPSLCKLDCKLDRVRPFLTRPLWRSQVTLAGQSVFSAHKLGEPHPPLCGTPFEPQPMLAHVRWLRRRHRDGGGEVRVSSRCRLTAFRAKVRGAIPLRRVWRGALRPCVAPERVLFFEPWPRGVVGASAMSPIVNDPPCS